MDSIHHKPVASINGLSLYFIGDVAVIEMDRGENRINKDLVTAYNELLDQVEKNSSCKGLITTGKGKFYGNGLDLEGFAKITPEETSVTLLHFVRLIKRLLLFPIPTLAALNGHAFAGGAILAFAHDMRTMRMEKGWMCLNEIFINLQLGQFNLKLLEMKLGLGRNYTDAVVLGKRYTGPEALQAGFVHSVQPQNLLLMESVHVLKSFYGKGYLRESLDAMKRDVYKAVLDVYEGDKIDEQIENAKNGIMPKKSRL